MFMLALILSSAVVSFSLIVLIEQLSLGVPWTIAAPEALIATVLGHWLVLLWLCHLGKGKK